MHFVEGWRQGITYREGLTADQIDKDMAAIFGMSVRLVSLFDSFGSLFFSIQHGVTHLNNFLSIHNCLKKRVITLQNYRYIGVGNCSCICWLLGHDFIQFSVWLPISYSILKSIKMHLIRNSMIASYFQEQSYFQAKYNCILKVSYLT